MTTNSAPRLRSILVALGAAAVTLACAATAHAAVTPNRNADEVARSLFESIAPGSVDDSVFAQIPPNGNPAAIGDSNLASFPLNGNEFAILSTGDAAQADTPDASNGQSAMNGGGAGGHGPGAQDVVTLRINLDVPENRNCMSFDFRFLSEEYPEYIGSEYNDGFVAELDVSDFSVADTGVVSAPHNVAQDEDGKVVTVNTSGTSNDNALGTTYDGATPILSATTPITAGPHVLFLSVYDSGDAIFDSSVFVDNLRFSKAKTEKCLQGTTPPTEPPERCKGEKATVIAEGGVAEGTKGDDVIYGSPDPDRIKGRGGDDLICGRGGEDEINGGRGHDRLFGNGGDDELRGNAGNDNLGGGSGNDLLKGQKSGDLLRGGKHDDELRGGGGDDILRGHQGDDALYGNAGDDRLRGNGGSNECRGGGGQNELGVGC